MSERLFRRSRDRKGIGTVRSWYLATLSADPLAHAGDPEPIEVFVPCGPNDIEVLPYCLAGVLQGIANPVERVVVATPRRHVASLQPLIGQFGADDAVVSDIVADEDVLSREARDALATLDGYPRAGWVAQQFLKLDWVRSTDSRHVLVLDADMVLLRPRVFAAGGRNLFMAADHYHVPYYEHVARALGPRYDPAPVSFTAHHMVMRPDVVSELAFAVARHTNTDSLFAGWAQTIDRSQSSPCSDYDLYGQFMYRTRPSEIVLASWRTISVSRFRGLQAGEEPASAARALAHCYPDAWSVGFHHYLKP